jgi:hypothetical protein
MNIINKQVTDKVKGNITSVINPTKKIADLEKSFSFPLLLKIKLL